MIARHRLSPRHLAPVAVHVAVLVAALLLPVAELAAAEVEIFRLDSHEDFAAGHLEGVSVHPHGTLQLARRIDRVTGLDEPFVFSAAAAGDRWIVGTGNAGKLLAVDTDGTVRELFTAEEPEIFAVLGDADGAVYAASSPAGKVYRVAADGSSEVVFDPAEQYVWALARDRAGDLLVATGLDGRLYRVGDGGAELVAEVGDSHLRSMAVLADGSILLGTAGQGRILRLGTDGELVTLHDSLLAEVAAFAPRPDGGAWAAVLASEASLLDLSTRAAQGGEAAGQPAVTVVLEQGTVGSRGSGATGPRSLLLDVAADGTVREVESFADVTIHSLAVDGETLWIGTGEEGGLYRREGEHLILEHDLEERQVPALVAGGPGLAAVTTNGAAVYRLGDEVETSGTFTSAVLDAEQPAQFGSFGWEGVEPAGTGVALSFRSGMSQQPDATWTEWTPPAKGPSVAVGELSAGRYVQWRAVLHGRGAATPRLRSAELSYRQRNQAPTISSFEVLDPGQILVPNAFNPANQTFEPWSPNREGIFTTLQSAPTADESRSKELWKKGYRTLTWEATDPNGDELLYDLAFRAVDPAEEADGERGAEGDDPEAGWLAMAEAIEDTWYSFDATVLPDGRYRFRLTASDGRGQPAEAARSSDSLSEETVIDNGAPQLVAARRRGDTLEVEIADAFSPLREAVVSSDAGEWRSATAADGLLDGRRELLVVAAPEGAQLLLLRVTDAAFNVVTFDLLAATR